MNSLRCSSFIPLKGLSRFNNMPGMARMSTVSCSPLCDVSKSGVALAPMPMFVVSPSSFLSSSSESVTWREWNFDGLPAKSCICSPSGPFT